MHRTRHCSLFSCIRYYFILDMHTSYTCPIVYALNLRVQTFRVILCATVLVFSGSNSVQWRAYNVQSHDSESFNYQQKQVAFVIGNTLFVTSLYEFGTSNVLGGFGRYGIALKQNGQSGEKQEKLSSKYISTICFLTCRTRSLF